MKAVKVQAQRRRGAGASVNATLPLFPFPDDAPRASLAAVTEHGLAEQQSTTFTPNQSQAVHRWFRYSAGFSAAWARSQILEERERHRRAIHVLDPFAGVGTSLLAAQAAGVASTGIEAHPFVHRIAQAKLHWSVEPSAFLDAVEQVVQTASRGSSAGDSSQCPDLLLRIYDEDSLSKLLRLRDALEVVDVSAPEGQLCWLALTSILRSCSHAGTAPWQYVLPKKQKRKVLDPFQEFIAQSHRMAADMAAFRRCVERVERPRMLLGDARVCRGVEERSIDLVLTSPPYPNNYDYADATRVELSFFGAVTRWSELHTAVRQHLVRSCSQHTAKEGTQVAAVVEDPLLRPIRAELAEICARLTEARETRAGKKTYDSMIAAYFQDMAAALVALGRVTRRGGRACLVIGDSAPYGVYVPVDRWLARLAEPAGFAFLRFDETRQRNLKWKNRKHRVPLREGRLWLERRR